MSARWGIAVAPLAAAALVLSGCGAGAAVPAASPSTVASSTTHGTVHPPLVPPVIPAAAARTAALAQAADLLNLLPAYPGGALITATPYATAASGGNPAAGSPALEPAVGVPVSPDLIDIYREWRVAAPASTVLSWAKAQAAAQGLHQTASGSSTAPTGAEAGVAFSRMAGGGLTPALQVSAETTASGTTWVRYDAMVIWTPPRPAGENLPSGVSSVHIQLVNGLPSHVVATVTVTSPSQVAHLVAIEQSLPVDTRGAHSCPLSTGQEVLLDFSRPGAPPVPVSLGTCGDAEFGAAGAYPALFDAGNALWDAAVALAGKPGWG